jgi:hypothetical protein
MNRVKKLEEHLSQGPFGDPAGLLSDRDTWYTGAAEVLGVAPLPAATGPTAAHLRLLSRAGIDQDITGERVLPASAAAPVGPAAGFPLRERLWTTDLSGDGDAAVREAVTAAFDLGGMPPFVQWRLRDGDAEVLAAGLRRLGEVFPGLGPSTLDFVHEVIVHDSPILSAYVTQVPEAIFLGSPLLREPPDVIAEALLHESLHEKSMAARLTRVLFAPGYTEETSPLLTLPWTLGAARPRRFSAWRLLSAAHVYTHLAIFCSDESVGAESRSRVPEYHSRGKLMLEALRTAVFGRCLGPDGAAFAEFLLEALAGLDVEARYALAGQQVDEPVATLR